VSEQHNDYSEDMWLREATEYQWRRFMSHDYLNPSRFLAYYLIADFFWECEDKVQLAEIGFGDCWDFRMFFKHADDRGKIKYRGYEIMPHFVRYASDEYWGYEFRRGGFLDLEKMSYDVIYTRHTLEHAHPMLWRKCLARMLRATKNLCILTWYMPPGSTRLMAKNWTGEGWHNRYYRQDVLIIINALGFSPTIWEVTGGDEVWALEREQE
jgi:hypothetical protein